MASRSQTKQGRSRGAAKSEVGRRVSVPYLMGIFEHHMPDAACELYFQTPYQLLVSVVLSAQTTDVMVNRCMEPHYRQGLDIHGVLALGEEGLLRIIRSIGLAPTKARHIVRLSKILLDLYGGNIPADRSSLEALPGVGRKTASVVLGEVFGHPTLAVDTHVFRVTHRLGLHNEKDPRKCEEVLLQSIPKQYLPKAHHWFILHGRRVCQARKPQCASCVVMEICPRLDVV